MADGVSVQISGVNEIVAKMESVKLDIRQKGGRSALRKAAQVVRDRAKAHALTIDDPTTRTRIFMNIVERWSNKRFRATGDLMFRVGVLGGAKSTSKDAIRRERNRRKKGIKSLADLGELSGAGVDNPGGDTYYWRFVEFGTQRAPAHPFMRPAMNTSVQEATNAFIREYDKALDRAIRRADKQASKYR